jgi:hypothetical protein
VMIRWRERWRMHRIVLPLLRESDSANFPSDFNLPVVIFLLDYQIMNRLTLNGLQVTTLHSERIHGIDRLSTC